MPDKKAIEKYVQIGDGQTADPEKIDARIRLIIRVLKALDGGPPSLETGVALATLKIMVEQELGQTIDVHLTVGDEGEAEQLRERLQRLHDRGLPIDTPPGAADPSVH